jgi:predicted nucleic acid-binding protein
MATEGRPRVFCDSSAIVEAIHSRSADGPARRLLRLGESGVVENCVSSRVLADLDYVLSGRHPEASADMALILDRAGFGSVPDVPRELAERCFDLTGYWPDASILAAASACGAEALVTFDATDLLGDPLVGPSSAGLRAVQPAEALDWCNARLREAAGDG